MDLLDASGGLSSNNEFLVSTSNSSVLGFSLSGTTIPAGTGLDFHKERKLAREFTNDNVSNEDIEIETNEDILQKEMSEIDAVSDEIEANVE